MMKIWKGDQGREESEGEPARMGEGASPVKVVCLVGGIPNDRQSELEYL
jgi:hypothetical protein